MVNGESFTYRPSLDGLRVLAVYVVVVYHSDLSWFGNGFIGVDLFFVLSGFLIGSILLNEITETGQIDVIGFYTRRIKRLLPAALFVLVVMGIVTALTVSRIESFPALKDAKAALLYMSNFRMITESRDYFGNSSETGFSHFWSLSVEEQFYMFFPVMLLLSFKFKRWFKHAPLMAVVIVALVSLCLQIFYSGDVSRAYYGTDTRVYQMLLGVTASYVFFTWKPKWSFMPTWIPVGLFVVLSTNLFKMNISLRGVIAALLSVMIICSLELNLESKTKNNLEKPVMVWLGKISYGTYLWHWPIIVWLKQHGVSTMWVLLLAATVGGTAMSWVSYNLVERRFGRKRVTANEMTPIIIGLGMSVALYLAIPFLGSLIPEGEFETHYLETQGNNRNCSLGSIDECIKVEGEGLKVHVMGDSYAAMLTPSFVEVAEREGWQLSMSDYAGCPWQTGLGYLTNPASIDRCETGKKEVYEDVLDFINPDVIILVELPLDGTIDKDNPGVQSELSPTIAVFESGTRKTLDDLSAYSVIIVESTPLAPSEKLTPLICLSRSGNNESCSFKPQDDTFSSIYRSEAEKRPNVVTVDLDEIFCGVQSLCRAESGGVPVFRDQGHLSVAFAKSIGAEVGEVLVDAIEVLSE